ncbi:calcium-binding protein [Allostella vacuolata]|nr:calcium-binding protein [Stella vacuolata]
MQAKTERRVTRETPEWECVVERQAEIGEIPVWAGMEGDVLYWIDIRAPRLYRTDLAGGAERSWTLPSPIGSFALWREGGGAVVALQSGVHDLDFATGALTLLHAAPYDPAHYRLNDGRCDRQGRFWVGSMRLHTSPLPHGNAHFYRLDQRGFQAVIPGVSIANGLAWSPDNRTMYIADGPNRQVLAFDYDIETGTPSNRRVFFRVDLDGGSPDGATVDAEGGYWVAMIRGGRILRYRPDGTLDRELQAPTMIPTMVAFGGADLDTLYLTTSSSHYADAAARAREPLAGSVFRCRPGVRGILEPTFAFHGRTGAA